MTEEHLSPLRMSSPDINEEDIARVVGVLRSGNLSIGPFVEEFERQTARFVGVDHGVAVSSGTSGLHLCMRAMDIGAGDEVITTPFSFVASANCVVYEGGIPVFVDIQEDSLNVDDALVGSAIGPRTRAILPVHVFGRPAAMAELSAIADRSGVDIIEDACEALGSEYRGARAGALGHAGVFGFYPNKQITTGEGGMIVTNDGKWAQRMRSMRNQGRSEMGSWLLHQQLGFNYRLDEMSAALGSSQLARIDELISLRERVSSQYQQLLANVPGVTLIAEGRDTTRMSWFVFVVRLDADIDRDMVAKQLGERGIPTRNYFPPIHLQPFYRDRFGYKPGQFPVTERVARSTLALPFHGRMSAQEIERVSTSLQQAVDQQIRLRNPRRSIA